MARHKLTDTRAKSAAPGWHGDGDGLWLRVSPSGSRSWVFVSIRHGRRREMGLGSYGAGVRQVSLAAARIKAEEVRTILGRGGDPFTELPEFKARAKQRLFGDCADEVLATLEASFKNEKHKAQWRMTLEIYAKPLRKIPVAEVSTDDVVRVLRPIWQEKTETASRLRGRIEKVLDYAKAIGLRSGENPARWKGHLDHILGKREKLQRGHHAAMPYAEVPAFMAKLQDAEGSSARALEFLILTAARTGEVMGATWDEIDFDAGLWNVPAARMKAKLPHTVPLPSRAMEILEHMKARQLSVYLFPGQSERRPLSNMAMAAVLRRLNADEFTVHGFRSSFRDWAGDTTAFPRDVAEMALAHKVGDKVELAYRRGSALAKRRELMQAWQVHCFSKAEATA